MREKAYQIKRSLISEELKKNVPNAIKDEHPLKLWLNHNIVRMIMYINKNI